MKLAVFHIITVRIYRRIKSHSRPQLGLLLSSMSCENVREIKLNHFSLPHWNSCWSPSRYWHCRAWRSSGFISCRFLNPTVQSSC